MKDSQHDYSRAMLERKYIKANNERFSTKVARVVELR